MRRLSANKIRIDKTVLFFEKYAVKTDSILDLGIENNLSKTILDLGYNILNTKGQDLDLFSKDLVKLENINVVTAFEILEHLVSPFEVLRNLPANKLIATVPLRLWFASAYKNNKDSWDRHYHEFEDWQFDWLIEKAGWKIIDREKWVSPSEQIGIRPLLRRFTPRYYAIYAER